MSNRYEKLFDKLFPINRSITGSGYDKSLDILKKIIPFKVIKFRTGKKVFDWKIPKVWNVKEAYLIDPTDKKIIDFKKNNLHLIGYSQKKIKKLDLSKLKKNLFTNKNLPNAIPYVTSYYKKNWGFCMSNNQYKKLKKGIYKVHIDTSFKIGNLKVGSYLIKGKSKKEIIFSSYLCHPSMANNELSGPLTLCALYDKIKNKKFNYSIRLLINPETIGMIAYISKFKEKILSSVIGGCVLTCLGNEAPPIYKKSKNFSLIDLAFQKILSNKNKSKILNFFPYGSDEVRFNSTGIDIPYGSFMRANPGDYKEYHSSLDNKKIMKFNNIEKNVKILVNVIKYIDSARFYKNLYPNCDVFLTKRNLINSLSNYSGNKEVNKILETIFWILTYSNGKISDKEIIDLSGISKNKFDFAVKILLKKKIIKEVK